MEHTQVYQRSTQWDGDCCSSVQMSGWQNTSHTIFLHSDLRQIEGESRGGGGGGGGGEGGMVGCCSH